MHRFLLVLLVLVLLTPVMAQTVSVRRAVFYSALVPGLGEMYAGNTNKGAFFVGVEAAILFGSYRLEQERDWKIDDSQRYAEVYAGVPEGSSDDVYRRIQSYYCSDDYNEQYLRDGRNYYLIYKNDPDAYDEYVAANIYTGDETWEWQSEETWRHYQTLRKEKQDLEVYAKFAFGAMLVNRVISIVDAARTARAHNRYVGSLSVQPDVRRSGFSLNYEYRF